MFHLRFSGDTRISRSVLVVPLLFAIFAAVIILTAGVSLPEVTPPDGYVDGSRFLNTFVAPTTRPRAPFFSSEVHRGKKQSKERPLLRWAQETRRLWLGLFLLASGIEANPGPQLSTSRVADCCIPDCRKVSRTSATSSFRCPVNMYSRWAEAIRSHYPNFEYKATQRVCSRHFVQGRDYYLNSDKARLYPLAAVPSKFLASSRATNDVLPSSTPAVQGVCYI
jgi:hypothetical protein